MAMALTFLFRLVVCGRWNFRPWVLSKTAGVYVVLGWKHPDTFCDSFALILYSNLRAMVTNVALLALGAVCAWAQTSDAASETNEPNKYTATDAAAVSAAQATAPTYSGTPQSQYKQGKVFDRFVEIWLENTDYDKAAGDSNLAYLASKGITLTNYFAVTHP